MLPRLRRIVLAGTLATVGLLVAAPIEARAQFVVATPGFGLSVGNGYYGGVGYPGYYGAGFAPYPGYYGARPFVGGYGYRPYGPGYYGRGYGYGGPGYYHRGGYGGYRRW